MLARIMLMRIKKYIYSEKEITSKGEKNVTVHLFPYLFYVFLDSSSKIYIYNVQVPNRMA